MPYIARQSTQEYTAAATATPTLLTHAANDIIFCIVTQDGGGTAISTATSGWTVYDPGAASGATRQAVAYKRAASSSETAPVFAGATDEWMIQQFIVKDVDTTTAMDFTPVSSAWNTVSSKASPSATASNDQTLLIYSWGADAALQMRHKIADAVYLDNRRSADGNLSSLVCYYQLDGSGDTSVAAPTVTMYGANALEGGHAWVVGFRNKSGGSLMPMVVPTCSELKWYGNYGATHETTTWNALSDITTDTIAGIAISTTAPTTASSSTGVESTPNGQATALSVTELTKWAGGSHTITSTDMTSKILSIQWGVSAVSVATMGDYGAILVLGSNGGGWIAYQLSQKLGMSPLFPYFNQIAIGAATVFAQSSAPTAAFDITQVTKVGIGVQRGTSSVNLTINVKNLITLSGVTLRGGGANYPASPAVLANALNAEWFYRLAEAQVPKQVLAKCNVTIGDGAALTYYDASKTSLAFPVAYDAIASRFANINAQSLTCKIKASAADTLLMTAAQVGGNQRQSFTIDATSSGSATYSFAGSSLADFDVTWLSAVACDALTFSGCYDVDGKGADFTGALVAAPASTYGMQITANGSALTGTEIDVTGTSASYHLELGASVTAITLADVTFTGTPATDKVHVSAPSGTVTITISGTTSLVAGDVTSAGATVVIAAPELYQSVTISGATAGSRIQIYDTDAATELYNGTPTFPYTWTDSIPAAADRPIRLRVTYVSGATAKKMIEASIGTCGITEGTEAISYLVNQEDDEVYNLNAIDGSTVADISIDDSTNRVKFNLSATGTFSNKAIYAYQVYWLNTATGIQDDFSFITAPDSANYLYENFQWKNIGTGVVTIIDGFPRDATTGLSVTLIDTSGGNICVAPDHVIPYSSGSGLTAGQSAQLMALPTAAQILAAAESTPIHADVRKVYGTTVAGAGTEADPWGPA